jgi:hypothetical protein
MNKYLFGLIGLALLASSLGQASMAAPAASGGCDCAASASEKCCPRCGCHECLVPVCHCVWEMKKVTEYKYKCVCQDICIPGRIGCKPCDDCDTCKDGCASGNCGPQAGQEADCGRHPLVRDVRKLVKYPVVKEVPVRKGTVEWMCPKCASSCAGCEAVKIAPAPATAAPKPASPAPANPAPMPMAPNSH